MNSRRTVYVVSGFGERTDWYRNLAADPQQGPPAALRPVFSRLGLEYDAELTVFDDDAPGTPVVALRPA